MGYQVRQARYALLALALPALALLGAPRVVCAGQEAPDDQAVGGGVFASTDADDSTVLKQRLHFDVHHASLDDYLGIELERARFEPLGQQVFEQDRAYVRFAGKGDRWAWRGRLGTDGHTWLGNAAVHAGEARRQEYFIEREVLETPMGLAQGLYHTFAGAAYDFAIDDRNVLTGFAGVQDFTGENRRLHLRGRYIRVLEEAWGLSLQARVRTYHSTDPGEFDYYSPRWYAEALPVLQLRRFRGRWQYRIAAGIGLQRDANTDWRRSRLVEAAVTSPREGRDWYLDAGIEHTDTPVGLGEQYGYTQLRFSFTAVF